MGVHSLRDGCSSLLQGTGLGQGGAGCVPPRQCRQQGQGKGALGAPRHVGRQVLCRAPSTHQPDQLPLHRQTAAHQQNAPRLSQEPNSTLAMTASLCLRQEPWNNALRAHLQARDKVEISDWV